MESSNQVNDLSHPCSIIERERIRSKPKIHRRILSDRQKSMEKMVLAVSSSESEESEEEEEDYEEEDEDEDDDPENSFDSSEEKSAEDQCDDSDSEREEDDPRTSMSKLSLAPYEVFVSPMTVVDTRDKKLFNCVILRTKNRLTPVYKMYYQRENKLILQAEKKITARKSNYYLFDMSRGCISSKLTKKSGNYVGKLRAVGSNSFTMVDSHRVRSEIGSVLYYDRTGDSLPRKLIVVLPQLNEKKQATPIVSSDAGESELIHRYKTRDADDLFTLTSKDPAYANGCYRLNFNGRVSTPSIKNFQMTPQDDDRQIYVQFGKVSDNRFHLDFRAPITPFQAFCMALTQFDL